MSLKFLTPVTLSDAAFFAGIVFYAHHLHLSLSFLDRLRDFSASVRIAEFAPRVLIEPSFPFFPSAFDEKSASFFFALHHAISPLPNLQSLSFL